MSELFPVYPVDKDFYDEHLRDFLPEKIVDIHTHVWLHGFIKKTKDTEARCVKWPSAVACENPVEDLLETYKLMFPDKSVTPLIFSQPEREIDIEAGNAYVAESAQKYNLSSLLLSTPEWDAQTFKWRLAEGRFLGAKVYLNFAPVYLPANEIRIFDFAPPHQLEVLNDKGMILMLHIPRPKRLRDPVNLNQLLEIEQKYPRIKLIVAHVGRAYCDEDVGDAFEFLSEAEKMYFDISANTNQFVFEKLIQAVGPKRILFGSDMPILRMRSRRICENEIYVNLVPKGLYGDVSGDKNMRELEGEEADKLTFFMYEEILAFKKAAQNCGLDKDDIKDIFCRNAIELINK